MRAVRTATYSDVRSGDKPIVKLVFQNFQQKQGQRWGFWRRKPLFLCVGFLSFLREHSLLLFCLGLILTRHSPV